MDALMDLRDYVAERLTVKNFAVLLALIAIGGGVTMALDRTGTTQLAENATFPGSSGNADEAASGTAIDGETQASGTITVTTLPAFPPIDSSTFTDTEESGAFGDSAALSEVDQSVLDQAEGSAQSLRKDGARSSTTLAARPVVTTVVDAEVITAPLTNQLTAVSQDPFAALDFGSSVSEAGSIFGGDGQSITVPGASGASAFVWTSSTGESIVTVFKGDRLVAKSRF